MEASIATAFATVTIVAFIAFFAAVFAFHAYRAQSLPFLAGLMSAQTATALYFFMALAALYLPIPSLLPLLSEEASSFSLLLVLSVFWMVLAVRPVKTLSPQTASSSLISWLVYTIFSTVVVVGFSLMAQPSQLLMRVQGINYDVLRQIVAGLAAGGFLVSAGFLAQRSWRDRDGISVWLLSAALILVGAVLLQYFTPEYRLSIFAAIGSSSFVAFWGLLADRARFLQMESELRRSLLDNYIKLEEQMRGQTAALALTREAIVHLDLDGKVNYANPSFRELINSPKDGVDEKPLKEVLPRPAYDALLPAVHDGRRGRTGSVNVQLVLGSGERNVQVSFAPILGEHSRVRGVHLTLIDVTEYHHHEQSLEEKVAVATKDMRIFKQCIENAADAMVVTDLLHTIVYVNEAFERTTGFSRREVTNQNTQFYREADSYPLIEIKRRLSQGMPWRGEVWNRDKAGRKFVTDLSVVPVANEEGQVERYLWIERDITARLKMENELKDRAAELKAKSEEIAGAKQYYESLINSINDMFIVFDSAGHCTFLNHHARERLGFSEKEMTLDKMPAFFKDIQRMVSSYGDAMKYEFREHPESIQNRHGTPIQCVWTAHPLFNSKEERLGVMAIGRELQEIRRIRAVGDTGEQERLNNERTLELQRRVDQLTKLLEISDDIRLNMGLDVIMQSVAKGILALGWQRVAVFHSREGESFDLVASEGFGDPNLVMPRKFRKLVYTDFAPYMLERFRISQSFFVDSEELSGKRPNYMPPNLEIPAVGEWHENDSLLAPIRLGDKMAGMVLVFSPEDGRRPDHQRVRDIEIFAKDAAIAIDVKRLFDFQVEKVKQGRLLANIGQFRPAGTLENVIGDIAVTLAEAVRQPVMIAVRIHSPVASPEPETDGAAGEVAPQKWLVATGSVSTRGQGDGRVIAPAQTPDHLLEKLIGLAAEKEVCDMEIASEDLRDLVKVPGSEAWRANYPIKLLALRSRKDCFGFVYWLNLQSTAEWAEQHADFVKDLIARTTLTIDNIRLFYQTEDKALQLQKANQLISEFLANVSHELRTPLNAILQFSEILLSGVPGALNDEQSKQLDIMRRSGKNLLALINDILDLSKIEAGKMEAIPEDLDPEQLIRETVETIRPLCQEKQLGLKERINGLPPRIRTDRAMLTRVLTNLLGNSVKFTDAGEVSLEAGYADEMLHVTVRDTGIGIPRTRLKEIFEPFRQLENTEARRHGGTGLGLAISQRMLAILGGKIEVTSEVNKGSTFTIHVPVQAPLTKERRKKTRPGHGPKPAAIPEATKLQPDKSRSKGRGPRVLVVEDDESTRYAMQFLLENEGYQVDFAEGGEHALQSAQRRRPDIILMDIMMPNMDGYQVSRALKAQKHLARIPVVALTARAMKGDREKALAAGCDDYLTKPFEKKDILEVIRKWVNHAE